MLKALPLVHFLSVLLLKEQMITSVKKTLKTLAWSAQSRSISSEICLQNNYKIGRFLPIAFWRSLPWNFPRNPCLIGRFFGEFVPKNPAKFDFFSLRPIRSPDFLSQSMRKNYTLFSVTTLCNTSAYTEKFLLPVLIIQLNLSTMASLGTEIIKWQLWGGRGVIMIPILWGKDTGSGRCSGEVAMHWGLSVIL